MSSEGIWLSQQKICLLHITNTTLLIMHDYESGEAVFKKSGCNNLNIQSFIDFLKRFGYLEFLLVQMRTAQICFLQSKLYN